MAYLSGVTSGPHLARRLILGLELIKRPYAHLCHRWSLSGHFSICSLEVRSTLTNELRLVTDSFRKRT